MPLDPRLQVLLDGRPVVSYNDLSPAQLRALANAGLTSRLERYATAGPDVASVVDHPVAVEAGSIAVRLYTPPGRTPSPAHLYLHGGGFWMGTLDHFDACCRHMAVDAGCIVASVDYRLAPEHPFPTPLEDCYAALTWLVQHASEFGIDPRRVSVGGASAGGNLAAALCLLARDRGGPPVTFQLLEIPVLDFTMSSPSITAFAGVTGTAKEAMETYRRYYVGDRDATDPLISPLLAPDLSGLPPALVITAEFDPLRDEGEQYARRLAESGVDVIVNRRLGQIHGSHVLDQLLPDEVASYREVVADTLRRAHRTGVGA